MEADVIAPGFRDAMARLVYKYDVEYYYPDREYTPGDVVVLSFEDYTETDGYCETCYYETARCKIAYTYKGDERVYDYYGSFSELLGDLVRGD
jgi:hypothetical protein